MASRPAITLASVSEDDLLYFAQCKLAEPAKNQKVARCQKELIALGEDINNAKPYLTDDEVQEPCEAITLLYKQYATMTVAAEAPVSGLWDRHRRRVTTNRSAAEWNKSAVNAKRQISVLKAMSATRKNLPTRSQPAEQAPAPATSPSVSSEIHQRLLFEDPSELAALLEADDLQAGVSNLIIQTREAMIVAPESERNVYISRLLKLYAYTRVYPCENGLSSFEVVPNFSKCEGRGSFGSCCRGVFLGMQPVALKSLSADDKEKMAKRLRREATLWAKLRHPRILRFIGLYTLDRDTYMVSPYMENGHATAYVAKQPDLNCLKLLSQIAEGLEYLHDMDVVHGDLRGPNILISASGDACIADFGLSRVLADFNPQLFSTLWHTAGNPRWLAPELLVEYDVKSRGPLRTKETDVFSFGRVIVELTTACAPFAELTDRSVQVKVQPGVSVNPMRPLGEAVLARGLDDDMWELAQDCWSLDPALRPTATEVLQRLRSASRDCASPVSV